MIQAIKKAVRSALVDDGTLVGLLSLDSAVYWHQAPDNADFPYIVFFPSGGGDENLIQTDLFDVSVSVKVVTTDSATAAQIADRIRTVLHNTALTYDDSWNAIWCRHDGIIDMIENVDGRQFFHAGGVYRLRASQ